MMNVQATLDPGVREIAILVVGTHFNAGYEIYAHGALAKNCGMSEERLATILGGSRPGDLTVEESCAFDTAKALTRGGILPEALYKRAVEVFGQHGDLFGWVVSSCFCESQWVQHCCAYVIVKGVCRKTKGT